MKDRHLEAVPQPCIHRCPRRYGWTSNMTTAILRHTSHENCAKNMTGFITVSHVMVEEEFDALCYDENGNGVPR